MKNEQYVCLVCGFNMVGFHPDTCPFCGASKKRFITGEQCSARYKVVATPVNEKVTRLNSQPALGCEHTANRIETDQSATWIDCLSSFDASLPRKGKILIVPIAGRNPSKKFRKSIKVMATPFFEVGICLSEWTEIILRTVSVVHCIFRAKQ